MVRPPAAPARELDIHFTIVVGRVITPGEQPQHHVGVQVVHRRVQVKAIRAVTRRGLEDHFRAHPLARCVGDAQVQPAAGIDPDVVRIIGKIIGTRADRRLNPPLNSNTEIHWWTSGRGTDFATP